MEWTQRHFKPGDLEGHFLAIAATSDTETNIQVFHEADRRAMLCNVVDVPPLCSFILPAIVRQGPIAIAISTAGASPALAKRMKREIGEIFGPEHAELAWILTTCADGRRPRCPPTTTARRSSKASSMATPIPSRCCGRATEPRSTLIAERQAALTPA